MLPCGINEWVHINCAIWSSDVSAIHYLNDRQLTIVCIPKVYSARGGCIKNIDSALLTGLKSCCSLCRLLGATVGCYNRQCMRLVHYKCALAEGWVFLKSMEVFCPRHGCSFDSKVCSSNLLL